MKCAILGNGPSRSAYNPENDYDLLIGCNIPWTKVDFTVIMDPDVIGVWCKHKDLITVPICVGTAAWKYTSTIQFRPYILKKNLFKELLVVQQHYSSGHLAARKAIDMGYKYIDLYGFDSYFADTMESYTREYVVEKPMNHVEKWRKLWDQIITSHPGVVFNFIKE